MRTGFRLIVSAFALALMASATMPVAAQARNEGCARGANALGVSRVVEIDATDGPRFGHQQYKDISFLRDREVVLTFDDGPLRRYTRAVLDALSAHCTRAVFFMVGKMAVADPGMVQEVVRHGHTVGTHTWSHRNLRSAGQNGARKEIELGISAVQKAAGVPIAPFFRFPYLSDPGHAIDYLRTRDIGIFSIEVDAVDFRTRSGDRIVQTVMNGLASKRKGIILFHDIQRSTASGLLQLLDRLKAGGYKVVHLVAKTPVETRADYDDQVDKEFARRKIVVAANPLVTRSLTWPINGKPPVDTLSKESAERERTPPLPTTRTARTTPTIAEPAPVAVAPAKASPSGNAASTASPSSAPAPAATRRHGEPQSWQSRAFSTTQ